MNSSIKIRKMVKIANPSSASMTRNSEISPKKPPSIHIPIALPFSCLVPTMVGHPVQSFFQLWWDTLYNPSATSMTRNLGFESLPFQKKQYLPYTYLFPLPCLFLCSELWRNTLYRLIIMRLLQKISMSAIACHDIQQFSINLPEFTQFVQLMN